MVSLNKTLLRALIIISYIMLIALVFSGISALFGYLNTGADRSTMLHTEIKKTAQYVPKIVWEKLENEGREMDVQTMESIQKDYVDAWYVRQIAYKTNKIAGIEDYYTENARKNIFQFIELHKKENITVDATTLEHHLTLEFFSEDGQLVVLSDSNVKEYHRLYKNEQLVTENTQISNYKVVLLLEDGFWRVRHLVQETSDKYESQPVQFRENKFVIKGVNYYPQETPWDMFGDRFNTEIIDKDFKIIKNEGLNTVRIFVPYEDFGKEMVSPEKLSKLTKTLNIASKNNLKVILTLFDFYGDYSVLSWTLNQRHAEQIVISIKDHPALLMWDIKNEPNLDFESRGKENVIAWLKNMIDFVRQTDPNHDITIGWSNTASASILKDEVNHVSFHYYEDLESLDAAVKLLKEEVAPKQIILQEFGISSYHGFWKPLGSSEEDQANYHKKVQEIIAANALAFVSWTLYDFTEVPKEVVGQRPWRKNTQKHFGFIDKEGKKKPSFIYMNQP